jgi:cytochrome c5
MGADGSPPPTTHEPMPSIEGGATGQFTLGGQDLYRLNCRSCHGPGGKGAPPEINNLLDPVRATSPALLEARQREQGRRLPPGMAEQLAADAEKTLRDRIANGGKKMPAFPHLAGDEVVALVSYLKMLAGVPAAESSRQTVILSAERVGEHVIKGTCHVCHPATGAAPTHMMMYMQGVIPSLASLPERLSPSGVVGKVRNGIMAGMGGGGMMGGRGMMGGGGMRGRMGRMPLFSYLTDEEVMAAYVFLSNYPPQPK